MDKYVLRLSAGIGSKILILISILYKVKETVFIFDSKSIHQKGIDTEQLIYLFPDLKKHPRIKFIQSWKEYDSLTPKIPNFIKEYKDISHPDMNCRRTRFFNFVYDNHKAAFKSTSIRKYFKLNPVYSYLDKLDLKHGIFVHFRLGDKLEINYNNLISGKKIEYILLKPEFYLDYIEKLRKKDEPVYICSDSPKIAKCLLGDQFEYLDLDANETFYCFRNCSRVILSDSTLTISAVYLGTKKKDLIYPDFIVTMYSCEGDGNPLRVEKSPFFEGGESDPKYLLDTLSDYKKIMKQCGIKF
jgi:hypothetical protein